MAWLAFGLLYLLFAGQLATDELVVAAIGATAVTAFAHRVARLALHPLQLRLSWFWLLRKILGSLMQEAAAIAALLLPWRRPVGGVVVQQPFLPGRGGPEQLARDGVVQLALSIAPNGYVLSPLPDTSSLPVHRLDPRQPTSPDRCWPL